MMSPSSSVVAVLLAVLAGASAKVYERCELARELRDVHRVPEDQLAVWVCIARHESDYNTTAVGHANGDGSGDHGIFQISDLYWCSHSGRGKACGMACSELLDNDIRDDMDCAKRIHREHQGLSGNGFSAWAVYGQYCKRPERAAKYLEGCFASTGNELQRPHEAYGLPPRPAITAPPPPRHQAAVAYGLPPSTPAAPLPSSRWLSSSNAPSAQLAVRWSSPSTATPSLSSRWAFGSATPNRPSARPVVATAPQAGRRFTPVFQQQQQQRSSSTLQRNAADPRNFWNWQFLPTRRWF